MKRIMERLVTTIGFFSISLSSLLEFDITEHSDTFHVVITDILFDGVGPLDFPIHLREAIPHEHLIIVTGMAQEQIKRDILAMEGVDAFFGIPFDLDEMEKQLLLF